MLLPNFNKVIQNDGKTFLKDESAISFRLHQVSELQNVLDDAAKFLKESDFPDKAEDIYNVLDDGREGLLTVVWNRADREAERLKVRPYVAQTWREQERETVTPEQWQKADALRLRYARIIDGLGIDRTADINNEDGGLIVDATSIAKRVEAACTIEITPEMKKDLDTILDLADKVKAMELRGINALELVEKSVRETERPDEAELYRRIVFRRHMAGTIHDPGLDWIMNRAALNNPNNNPLKR